MDGQFADKGPQYRTAIFVSSKEQEEDIKQSLIELESLKKFDDPIVTKILPESEFFPAEEYHQNYYQKIRFIIMRIRLVQAAPAFR